MSRCLYFLARAPLLCSGLDPGLGFCARTRFMIRPVFPFGPFRPFIAIYTLNGRRRRYHRLNKQPAGNDGDDELVNSHDDDDDDDRDGDGS